MQMTLMHTVRLSSYYLLVSYYFVQIPTHLKTYTNILLWNYKNYVFLLSVSTSDIRIPYISIQKIFMMYYFVLNKGIRYTLILY